MSADGRLLKPSRPLTSIDAMFSIDRSHVVPRGGQVWESHSVIGNRNWYYLVAVDLPTSFRVTQDDFWPPSATFEYLYRKDSTPLSNCVQGSPARYSFFTLPPPLASIFFVLTALAFFFLFKELCIICAGARLPIANHGD